MPEALGLGVGAAREARPREPKEEVEDTRKSYH